jgi:hypothetical protein
MEIPGPNPRRVAAGRRNRQRWQGFTPDGLQRLRQQAQQNRPWQHSTGPKTAQGKSRSAANWRKRARDVISPALLEELRASQALLADMVELRRLAASRPSSSDRSHSRDG